DFESKKKAAVEEAIRDFDKLAASVRRQPGLLASARKDKLAQIEAAKKEFRESAAFPDEDDAAVVELKYNSALQKAYAQIAKLIDEVYAAGNRTKNEEVLAQAQKLKEECEKLLPEAGQLTLDSRWTGRLLWGNEAVPFEMTVTKRTENGLFSAKCHYTR